MAITNVGSPKDLNGNENYVNPAYNPIVYYYDSTNKSEDGFRYIAVIKDVFGNKLFEKTLIPDIDNQYGVLNLNRELSNYISYDIDLTKLNGNVFDAKNSYLKYEIEIGEEYYVTWDAEGTIFMGSSNWPNWGSAQYNPDGTSKTGIRSVTEPIMGIGSTVNINITTTSDATISNQLSGIHNILDKWTDGDYWYLVMDYTYISGVSYQAEVKYADNRKTRVENLYSSDDNIAINTALSKKDWLDWAYINYQTKNGHNEIKFLTQAYDYYPVREDSTIFLNWLAYGDTTSGIARKVYFENDAGDASIFDLDNGIRTISSLDVSPTRTDWGTSFLGSLPIIKPNTKSYKVALLDINSSAVSEDLFFEIDRSCPSKDRTEILFMDKMGSFLPFAFNGRTIENHNIERSEYTKQLGGFDAVNSKYNYGLDEGGSDIYNSYYNKTFTLNTDYLNSQESEFFHNVMESPVTLIKLGNDFFKCIMTTNTVEVKKKGWYEKKRYNVTVKLSNNESINI